MLSIICQEKYLSFWHFYSRIMRVPSSHVAYGIPDIHSVFTFFIVRPWYLCSPLFISLALCMAPDISCITSLTWRCHLLTAPSFSDSLLHHTNTQLPLRSFPLARIPLLWSLYTVLAVSASRLQTHVSHWQKDGRGIP